MKAAGKVGFAIFTVGLIAVASPFSARAQGTFQNLGFESANLSSIPAGQFGGEVSSSNGIPYWSGYLGSVQVTQVLQNNLTLGNASIDILGPNWNLGSIIDGQYTVVLQPGVGDLGNGNFGNVSASITQTATVPANSQSLQFKAQSGNFSVVLGGQPLSIVQIGTGPNYTAYGANIPSIDDGQNMTLAVSVPAGPNNANYFDSFFFSPQTIPEPSTWALLALGGGGLLFRRRKAA